MTSDPNHVRDEEIATVRDEGPTGPPRRQGSDGTDQTEVATPSGATDTGAMMDAADTGTADVSDVPTPSGATDTGAMMDTADTGTADVSDVPTPSGAIDTGAMMDARDTGTVDRTDVGERGDADADEPDR